MNKHPDWNEFQWEREIRRDERRISCYFRELPGCLDLPGEDEIIFEQLSAQPDLVPTGAEPERMRSWCYFEEEDDDDRPEGETPRSDVNGEIVDQIDRLAVGWNWIAAAQLSRRYPHAGLAVSCAYGKLLARAADFYDADPVRERALKITLGKRTLADLNDLIGVLREVSLLQHGLADAAAPQFEQLVALRERLIDRIALLRKQP